MRKKTIHTLFLLLFCTSYSSYSQSLLQRLQRLQQVYSQHFTLIDTTQISWKDGTIMQIDDKKVKTHEQRLAQADIQDQLVQNYPKNPLKNPPQFNEEAGRIRCEEFFRKMYGNSPKEVEQKLTTIRWLRKSANIPLKVTTINNVHLHLQAVSDELEALPKHLHQYFDQPAGTYYWRLIAGTDRLSTHSFGIAIDINVKFSDYWQWSKPTDKGIPYKNRIPYEIVAIFEKHGFIWGGKWYHYDTMHFEFRPELL
ncbi:MAG: M15 family metallopeptidase [Thermoflexibacteraceae bacterium]